MSPCTMPRLGTEPSLRENDKVSRVRFSSSTLSLPETGMGSGVGVAVLSGRKIVLKPLPLNVPVKAASGPTLGAGKPRALSAVRLDTSPKAKPLGCERAVSRCMSLMVSPLIGPCGPPVSAPWRVCCRKAALAPQADRGCLGKVTSTGSPRSVAEALAAAGESPSLVTTRRGPTQLEQPRRHLIHPRGRLRVRGQVEPSVTRPEQLLWAKPDSTWSWTVRAMPDGRMRLVTRLRQRYRAAPATCVTVILAEFGDYPMMRKMLLGIKQRAETAANTRTSPLHFVTAAVRRP